METTYYVTYCVYANCHPLGYEEAIIKCRPDELDTQIEQVARAIERDGETHDPTQDWWADAESVEEDEADE